MSTQPISTRTTPWSMSPDVAAFPADEAIPDALILAITTRVAVLEGDAPMVRVPVVADAVAAIVREGDDITEIDPEISETTLSTALAGALIRVSREQWHQESAGELLSASAQRSIISLADDALLNAPLPTPPEVWPPGGLLATPGLPDAGAVAGDVDTLIDAVSAIRAAGGTPSHLLLAPSSWASLQKFKAGDGSNLPLLGSPTAMAAPSLLGLPIIVNAALAPDSGMIVDDSDVISAFSDVQVATSEDAAFRSNSILLRVLFRFGAKMIHPTRHARFDVTATAP